MIRLKDYRPELVLRHTSEALRRFPLVLLATIGTWFLSEALSRNEVLFGPFWVTKLLQTFFLLIPTTAAVTLLWERRARWASLLPFLVPLYFLLSYPEERLSSTIYVFGQLLVATHLAVAIAPYFKKTTPGAFWEFNKTLFLRFFVSSIYSTVLLTGICLCLAALHTLFSVPIKGADYESAFYLTAFLFHPLHFLAGVPRDFERAPEYPNGLRIFSKNLLFPLIAVFGAILAAYAVLIVLRWNWPRGNFSGFITVFAVVGVLWSLLVAPLVDSKTSWFPKAEKSFFFLLGVLSAFMLAAVVRRISDYGFTEERELVAAASLWLIGISLHRFISSRRTILSIPVSLTIGILLLSIGPWGTRNLSRKSQLERLEEDLRSAGLWDGKTMKDPGPQIPEKIRKSIASRAYYLSSHHGDGTLQKKFNVKNLSGEDLSATFRYKDYHSSQTEYWHRSDISSIEEIPVKNFSRFLRFSLELARSGHRAGDVLELTPKGLWVRVTNDEDHLVTMNDFLPPGFKSGDQAPLRIESAPGKVPWLLLITDGSGTKGNTPEESRMLSVSGILLY